MLSKTLAFSAMLALAACAPTNSTTKPSGLSITAQLQLADTSVPFP